MNNQKTTIIIPAYNEGDNIAFVISKIKKSIIKNNITGEIIVIGDGSVDGTGKNAKKSGAKVYRHKKNLGKGAAIRHSISLCKTDTMIFIDGDGQDDPNDIPKILKQLENGADVVIGSRWLGVFKRGAISKRNYFLTNLTNLVINLLFNGRITDSQAGFRGFKKDKISDFTLRSKQYEIETEMLIKSLKKGLKIVEVPVTRYPRINGETNSGQFYMK